MTFALGVFELFTYMIPGSLYIGLFGYVGTQLGWFDAMDLQKSPSLLMVLALALAAYVIGQGTYNVARLIERLLPRFMSRRSAKEALEGFIRRPGIRSERPFLQIDIFTLVAAAELNNKDAAAEISRLRAVGLMLRNVVPPLLLGSITSTAEIFTSSSRVFAGTIAVLLVLIALGCFRRASTMRSWATTKTLELCYWIKDIDQIVANGRPPAGDDTPNKPRA